MMKTKVIIIGCLCCAGMLASQAQNVKTEEPKGKGFVQVFGNFHTGFGSENDDRGFELDRTYLGYAYDFGKGLSVKGVMDIGKSDDVSDHERIAYIKNAMVTWKKGKLTLNGGLIPTTQFCLQETLWGYRYVKKSFQDEYRFNSSADLGISAAWLFADWITADAIIVNGEGYKKIQKKDGMNYGLGITVTPAKGLLFRLYAGVNEGCENGQKDIFSIAGFAGYQCERFRMGMEYNRQQNASNKDGADLYGYSAYTTVLMSKTTELYARYDNLCSKNDWNKANDEQTIMLGAQFKLGKYVKIAPNFRMSIPTAEGMGNKYSAYISSYFGI